VVLEERRMRTDATPTGTVQEAFTAMVWEAHPYSWPIIGWPSDITQVTRDQADAFFTTYYAPNNITAILVGDFKAEEAYATVERYFGGIPANSKAAPQVTTLEPPQTAEQRMVAEVESNPELAAAYKTVPSVHKDAPALEVLAAILSGASGRLDRSLVREQKVAVYAGAFSQAQKYGGLFYLFAGPPPELRADGLESPLFKEIAKIQEGGVTERELQKVKNQAQAAAYTRMESSEQLRDQLAEAESAGSYRDFLDYPARIQAVTREDVQRVARQYLVPEKRNTLVLRRKMATTAPEGSAQVQETK
jgi:predicted Zn-dependent peptidase